MKLEIEHAPGELAEKVEDVIDRVRALAEEDGGCCGLSKSANPKPKRTYQDFRDDFRFPATLRMFDRAMMAAAHRSHAVRGEIDSIIGER